MKPVRRRLRPVGAINQISTLDSVHVAAGPSDDKLDWANRLSLAIVYRAD